MAVTVAFGIVGCNNDKPGDTQGVTYTVTFDVQGHGTAPENQAVAANGHAVQPKAPTASGWTFGGWYKEAGCLTSITRRKLLKKSPLHLRISCLHLLTIVAKGGEKSGTIDEEWRTIQMVNVNNSSKVVAAFDIPSGQDIVTNEISEGGTYRIASKGSNIDVYYIIIEYYA